MNTSLESQMAPTLPNRFDALQQRLGPIEHRPIAVLKRYENNPRKHPEKQLVKLAASIRDFGFAVPVLIDEVGTIIAVEARVDAASRIGMSEVPVIVAQYWSPAQVRAYRLADNRLAELASWDSEALAIELAAIIEFDETPIEILGWETAEIDLAVDDLRADSGAQEQDTADIQVEPQAVPVSRPSDLWHLGAHRLLCCSSLDGANRRLHEQAVTCDDIQRK